MAKTIRSHLTSHILVSEPICWTTLIFSKFGPEMDLRVLHFPTSPQVKRPTPKGNKMRMDHPFILGFCQNVFFYISYLPYICVNVWGKTHFLKLVSYFNSFVYLRFKYRRPQIIMIIIISKQNSYFKIRTLSQRYINILSTLLIIQRKTIRTR